MKDNKELNQQVRNTAVDKKGRPTISIDERKSIYTNISEALKAIPITNRNVGLTISIYNGIKVVEYWWEKGIKDSDLVEKINGDDIPRINTKLIDLQNQIDEINNIEFKVFDSLPELGDSSIIYVIPNTVSQEDDDFIEYFWIKSQQRYQRFGGFNLDGGVTINNFYQFDNNIFNVDEESNIKKVFLNDKKISIGDNGINIYKFNVGEINNELQVNIDRTIYNTSNVSYGGGRVLLYGYYNQNESDSKIYTTSLNYNTIDINCEEGNISYRSTLSSTNLHITDNDTNEITISKDGIEYETNNGIIFEMNNSNFRSISNKILIKATGLNGFDINYNDDCGIKGFSDNNVEKLLLYTIDNQIVITNNNIELNIAGDSYINLSYNTFNATFDQLIYLNAPITKVKKVLFEQNSGNDIYLEPYHETNSNVIYHGLKSESNIYIKDTNSYFVKSQNNYSLTSYGLNGIKHRDSNRLTSLGYDILNIGDGGVLSLGMSNELTINNNVILLQQDANQLGTYLLIDKNNNEISLQKGNNSNRFIKIDTNNNIKLKNEGSEININYDNEIQLKGNNNGYFNIDTDGWCIMKGYASSKIGLVGTNNEQSYFVIEEGGYTLPEVKIHQNLSNYIYLYKSNADENHITIKSEYFEFIDGLNNKVFSIDSDNDISFRPGNTFAISVGDNFYKFILDNTDGITLGKTNKVNVNNNNIQFTLGSKVITMDETGISDGTNTKTWAQLLS